MKNYAYRSRLAVNWMPLYEPGNVGNYARTDTGKHEGLNLGPGLLNTHCVIQTMKCVV